jgi:hypothetical protein
VVVFELQRDLFQRLCRHQSACAQQQRQWRPQPQ